MSVTCSIEGCDGRRICRSWCNKHYQRWYKFGDAHHIPPKSGTVLERFERRKIVDPVTDCWTLPGDPNTSGYSQIAVGSRWVLAHRWSYRQFVGPILKGLVLDHLCRNRRCVNPEHLEPVTQAENLLRGNTGAGRRSRTGTCANGHDAETYGSVYTHPTTSKSTWYCKACRAVHESARRARLKESA